MRHERRARLYESGACRLRHGISCRSFGRGNARARRRSGQRGVRGKRIPLLLPENRRKHAGGIHQSERRNGGHACRPAGSEATRRENACRGERGTQHPCKKRRRFSARESGNGNRGGFHEGVFVSGGGAVCAGGISARRGFALTKTLRSRFFRVERPLRRTFVRGRERRKRNRAAVLRRKKSCFSSAEATITARRWKQA